MTRDQPERVVDVIEVLDDVVVEPDVVEEPVGRVVVVVAVTRTFTCGDVVVEEVVVAPCARTGVSKTGEAGIEADDTAGGAVVAATATGPCDPRALSVTAASAAPTIRPATQAVPNATPNPARFTVPAYGSGPRRQSRPRPVCQTGTRR